MPDLTEAEVDTTDFGTYTADQFFDDMAPRLRKTAPIPIWCEILVTRSYDHELAARKGVRFMPI